MQGREGFVEVCRTRLACRVTVGADTLAAFSSTTVLLECLVVILWISLNMPD